MILDLSKYKDPYQKMGTVEKHIVKATDFKEFVKKLPKKKSKYRNVKTTVDGITFDSKKESQRYKELKILQEKGEIHNLNIQVSFDLKVCKYKADFTYNRYDITDLIVEDVKSEITRRDRVYRIKAKLMKLFHGIDIREV